MEKKTVHLKVFASDCQPGSLFFYKGYLVDAEYNTMTGEKAVLEMLEWDNVTLTMKEYCPSTITPDPHSQLIPLLFDMPYHKERAGELNPLDTARREFIQLQKKRNEQVRSRKLGMKSDTE
ncbi:MAG: DUF4388 domain-containing protein [Candidatus Electrothrix sp. MAN1_4]|nr:DUF4388 domain-containing protein [Candidatus Electrothrix sp. MAN1_4]